VVHTGGNAKGSKQVNEAGVSFNEIKIYMMCKEELLEGGWRGIEPKRP
jgi:hypothetical protein